MVIVKFDPGETRKTVNDCGLWQYDHGQKLRIEGLELAGSALEVDFAVKATGTAVSIPVAGVQVDGGLEAAIPDDMFLKSFDKDYYIYAFIYMSGDGSGETTHKLALLVTARPSRSGASAGTAEDPFADAIEAVNSAASRAEYAMALAEQAQSDIAESAAQITANKEGVGANAAAIEANRAQAAAAAPGIVLEASGDGLAEAGDSAEWPIAGLKVYGRSEQKTTTGAQLLPFPFDEIDKTVAGIAFEMNADASVSANGTAESGVNYVFACLQLSAGTYTAIAHGNLSGIYLRVFDEDDSIPYGYVLLDGSDKSFSFTVTKDITNVRIYLNTAQIGSVISGTIWPMLVKGDTALPWEPYTGGRPSPSPEYPQGIASAGDSGSIGVEVGGGNLFNKDAVALNNEYDAKIEQLGNGIRLSFSREKDWVGIGANVKLRPNTSYTLSCDITKLLAESRIGIRKSIDGGKTYISTLYSCITTATPGRGLHVSFTTDENEYYRVCLFCTGKTAEIGDTTFENVMLNEGTTALPWEPYKHQSLALPTPNGLPGIPVSSGGNYTDADGQQWVCDEIDLERGVYVQRVIVKEFDGSSDETWLFAAERNNRARMILNDIQNNDNCKNVVSLSTHFAYNPTVHSDTSSDEEGFIISDKSLYVRFGTRSDIDTVAALKQWMHDNTPQFLMILAEPIEAPIPAEELASYKALHTNYPTTVITNDAGAHMAVSYVADTKAYIDAKFQELQTALANTQAQII